MFGGLGYTELILIALILLLLFGARRIPAIMGSFGEGIRQFKSGFKPEVEAGAEPMSRPDHELPAGSRSGDATGFEVRNRDQL
jgi:sec-independent protein translocase protein TatA